MTRCPTRAALLAAAMLAVSVPSLWPAPAAARTSIGVGVGVSYYGGHPHYPPYYYRPRYYYYPPPVYYYPPPPPPVVYVPVPTPAPQAAPAAPPVPPASQTNCRDYESTMTIDGRAQKVTGTACLQADGTWRIVR